MLGGLVDTRVEMQDLFDAYLWIGVAVAVIVFAAVGFAIVRYRGEPGREPSRRSDWLRGELVYVGVLVLIVAGLVTATFTTEDKVDAVSDDPALRVDVTAFQWGWTWTYPDGVSVSGNSNSPHEGPDHRAAHRRAGSAGDRLLGHEANLRTAAPNWRPSAA